ncbi:MAG: hydratase [Pseudolabrys sp.]|nr:hydratase [Pseudolabrys sp.]MDP2296323.1 hydratase [Pseudolabrys sp.]
MNDTEISGIATEALGALAAHTPLAPFSARASGFTLADASRVTPLLRAGFEARGETILGRKIGFTNRGIWAQYGVYAPIWGYMTSATVHALADIEALPTADFCEPRIEPEIIFGLSAAPTATMDDDALLACIGWLALGYEIVQSPFPDWKFQPADTVAANGLHGALLIGERHAVAPRAAEWQRELADFTARLLCDGALIDQGGGAAVLDSPFKALRHLVGMLANDPHNPPLAADEIVSTGTLTKAFPVKPGEIWRTEVAGIPLAGVTVRFA